MISSKLKVVHVKEAWRHHASTTSVAQSSTRSRDQLVITAFKGFEAYLGIFPLSEKEKWSIGVNDNADDAEFNGLLTRIRRIPDVAI